MTGVNVRAAGKAVGSNSDFLEKRLAELRNRLANSQITAKPKANKSQAEVEDLTVDDKPDRSRKSVKEPKEKEKKKKR